MGLQIHDTDMRRRWPRFNSFIVNFENNQYIVLYLLF